MINILIEDCCIRLWSRVQPEEIMTSIKAAEALVYHVRQVKGNAVNETNTKMSMPLWIRVISVPRSEESVNKLKSIRGLFHFTVRFEDLKARSNTLQCFRCQVCNKRTQCVKCAGHHNTRDCQKTRDTPAKCINCEGEHPAIYRACPIAQEYKANVRSGATHTPVNSAPKQPLTDQFLEGFPSLPR